MSWFYEPDDEEIEEEELFKYILCLGSTKGQGKLKKEYVIFKYILCLGST